MLSYLLEVFVSGTPLPIQFLDLDLLNPQILFESTNELFMMTLFLIIWHYLIENVIFIIRDPLNSDIVVTEDPLKVVLVKSLPVEALAIDQSVLETELFPV